MPLYILDGARLALGVAVLAFATFTDLRWRRAPDVLWWGLGGVGLAFLVIEAAARAMPAEATLYLGLVPLFVVLVHLAYRFRLIFGGADAKALMALALLVPWPIALAGATPLASLMPGYFSVLGNALLFFLAAPLALAAWNVVHGTFSVPHMFLGTRVPVPELALRAVWPMQRVEEGRLVTRFFPPESEEDLDTLMAHLRNHGIEEVWATPKLPFMVPLALGYVVAWFGGDVLMWGTSRLLA